MHQVLLLALTVLGANPSLALQGASVIDVADGAVRREQTLLITDNRIAQVGPTAELELPAETKKVNATGKFVVPGLWDMHVHFASADYAPLFIANGVVGVRDMHAHVPFILLPLRTAIAQGKVLGPEILTAISMVDGAPPMWADAVSAGNPEAGRKAVQSLKARKADFVKIYSGLDRETFLAICDEAKKLDLAVVGHIPEAVSAIDASNAGVRSMEHIFGILTASATNETELRQELVTSIRGVDAKQFYPLLIRSQLKALDNYNAERADALFATLAKNRTYQCPTMTVHRMFANLTDPEFAADPRTRFTPKLIKFAWTQALQWVTPIAQNASDQQRLYVKTKDVVRAMHQAGVPILAGTDTSNPYCLAGFSLHDELELLVESGLTPLAALQSATLEPARYLKREDSQGSVAVGHRADLLLLDANPLEDIRNTTKIHAVVLGGQLLDRAALDAMLTKAEATAAKR
jgi:imidazolonepropionase-like amidohydrolase